MSTGEHTAEARLARILDAQSVLAEVAASLGPDLDIDEVLTTVLTAMRKIVDFKGGTVQLIDERGVYIAASDPPVPPEMGSLRLRVGEGISGRVISTGRPLWSGDIKHDDRVHAELRATGSNLETRSYLAVPLICLGETIGALQIDSREPDAFDIDDVTLLEGLAAQWPAVIESARRFAFVMELERLKSDFISRVSHELRTPITIIDGFVMTMLDHSDRLDAEARRDMLTRCRTASARLSRLIEELITLARIETGVIQSQPAPTKVAKLLREVAMAATDPSVVPCGSRRGSRAPPRSRAHEASARTARRQRGEVREGSDDRRVGRRCHRDPRSRSRHRRRREAVDLRAVHPAAGPQRHPRARTRPADGPNARRGDRGRDVDRRPPRRRHHRPHRLPLGQQPQIQCIATHFCVAMHWNSFFGTLL